MRALRSPPPRRCCARTGRPGAAACPGDGLGAVRRRPSPSPNGLTSRLNSTPTRGVELKGPGAEGCHPGPAGLAAGRCRVVGEPLVIPGGGQRAVDRDVKRGPHPGFAWAGTSRPPAAGSSRRAGGPVPACRSRSTGPAPDRCGRTGAATSCSSPAQDRKEVGLGVPAAAQGLEGRVPLQVDDRAERLRPVLEKGADVPPLPARAPGMATASGSSRREANSINSLCRRSPRAPRGGDERATGSRAPKPRASVRRGAPRRRCSVRCVFRRRPSCSACARG